MREVLYEIKDCKELIAYLSDQGIAEPLYDFSYQLDTNYGLVYILEGDKCVFLPHDFSGKGILYKTRKALEQMLKNDYFPLEHSSQNLFESEIDQIRNINQNIDNFRVYLNEKFKLEFNNLTKEALQGYLKKVIGRSIRGITTNKDLVALIGVVGELFRKEVNGKWFLFKRYGKYNPYFEPQILTDTENVVMISDLVLGNVKWKVSSLETIFNRINLSTEEGIRYKDFCTPDRCIILD